MNQQAGGIASVAHKLVQMLANNAEVYCPFQRAQAEGDPGGDFERGASGDRRATQALAGTSPF